MQLCILALGEDLSGESGDSVRFKRGSTSCSELWNIDEAPKNPWIIQSD